MGVVPGLRVAWVFTMGLAGLTVAYLGALVHMRTNVIERSTKVAFLDPHRPPEPAFVLRRSAN